MIKIILAMKPEMIYTRREIVNLLIKPIPAITIYNSIQKLIKLQLIEQFNNIHTKPAKYRLTERGARLNENLI